MVWHGSATPVFSTFAENRRLPNGCSNETAKAANTWPGNWPQSY